MLLLGYDIGSSSVKASLVDADTKTAICTVKYPEKELEMQSLQLGWAEQDPETWWNCIIQSTKILLSKANISSDEIASIGIAYQMHGLVLVDKNNQALRPSIIWCDSRAIDIGNQAFEELGAGYCLKHVLNSPGNFTASKLAWVKENEPDIYSRIHKIMLPGDYIAMKLSGEINTTISGLSEGIFWDFQEHETAEKLMEHFGFESELIPDIVDTFSIQSKVSESAAKTLGLKPHTPITYRAGDQPNNALALQVFEPGEIAATGGTSGVVYGISDQLKYDELSRINSFAHVNHSKDQPRIGQLLCINGAGSMYAWTNHQVAGSEVDYPTMERDAQEIPVGSDGLTIIPFGNGAERVLENKNPNAQINHIQFNVHNKAHIYRASLEGIAFSFVYGIEILKSLGVNPKQLKVGNDNLFQSSIFSQTIANLTQCEIEIIETTGAIGAALASGVAINKYKTPQEAVSNTKTIKKISPEQSIESYKTAYKTWSEDLQKILK